MFRWLEHTGELQLEVDAATEEDVFAEAVAALGEVVAPDAPAGPPADGYELDLSSPDRSTLLADLLGELVYLAETREFVPRRLAAAQLSPTRLVGRVEGDRGEPRHLVKAVTYHDLAFERSEDGGWRARVVLDV